MQEVWLKFTFVIFMTQEEMKSLFPLRVYLDLKVKYALEVF